MAPALPIFAFLFALAVRDVAGGHFIHTPDTDVVLNGTGALDRCIDDGFRNCDDPSTVGRIGYVALLQYLPALAFKRLGLTWDQALHGLVYVNAIACVVLLAVMWLGIRRVESRLVPLAVASVLAGPLLFYADGSWGEPLAALATAGMVAALLAERTGWAALALVLASLSKETALPLLLVLAGLALTARTLNGRAVRRREVGVLAAAAALGLAVTIGFNLLRFGQPTNPIYAQPGFVITGLKFHVEWTVAQLFAPNGGILLFWPLALGPLVLVPVAVRGERRMLGCAVALTVLVIIVGLAGWFAPLGWQAWGPRLLMPWLPAAVLLALYIGGEALGDVAERWTASWTGRVAAALLIAVFALPHLGAHLEPGRALDLFAADRECPAMSGPEYFAGPETLSPRYFSCQRYVAWEKSPTVVHVLGAFTRPGNFALGLLLVAMSVGLFEVSRVRQREADARRLGLASGP